MHTPHLNDDPEDMAPDGGIPAGNALTIEQAIANLRSTDAGDRYYAAWWLGRFRIATPEAVAALIETLTDESDRTPDGGYPLRRNAARALGKLGDLSAVPGLLSCLDCSDYYVREAAAQSLGKLGSSHHSDPIFAPCTLKLQQLLAEEAPAVAAGVPHAAQPYDAILEALGALGATHAIPTIEPFLTHPAELVQYAAARAMYQLTEMPVYGDRLVSALQGDRLQLRRAALADIGAIGYLPAAEPIAKTLAENSLKLIALKGLLEHHLHKADPLAETAQTQHILQLMDELL
ncbi:MAG TPA: HEAT repeat domain-containing protein [Stenomitos sp.]